MDPNFYKILGISRTASLQEVRAAYRALARRLHPDKNVELGETELFLDVQNAYEILSDPQKRAAYDANLQDDPVEKPAINTSITYSRNSLLRIDGPQLIYVLLELIPEIHISKATSPPLNICLVLDISTSMRGRFLDMVKATALKLVKELRKQDVLSIVTFSDHAYTLVPAQMIKKTKDFESKIRMLDTMGGTEIYKGLERGYGEVLCYLSDKRINHIILITDGRTYGDEDDCLRLSQKAANQGIGISGLGIGNKWNDDFLDALTAKSGGNSLFVTDPQEIPEFLSAKLVNLSQRVIQNVTFDFNLDEGVEMLYAYRLQPDAAPIPIGTPSALGSIAENTHLKVLYEFMVHDLRERIEDKNILEGSISMDIPARSQTRETIRIEFDRPTGFEYSQQITDKKIVDAMSKLTLYRMQERAKQDIEEGNPQNAAKKLHYLATQLLARGEMDLSSVVEKEANRLQEKEQLSEQGEKRIKYGTRSLLLPEELKDRGDD